MTFTGLPPIHAPMATGHPASLPALTLRKDPTLRVEPSGKGGETAGTALRQGHTPPHAQLSRRTDGTGDTTVNGTGDGTGKDTASAPPTILQIKIGEMLREQAEANDADATRPARGDTDPAGQTAGPDGQAQEARTPDRAEAQPGLTDDETAADMSPESQMASQDTAPTGDSPARDTAPGDPAERS